MKRLITTGMAVVLASTMLTMTAYAETSYKDTQVKIYQLYSNNADKPTTKLCREILLNVTDDSKENLDSIQLDKPYDKIITSFPSSEYAKRSVVAEAVYLNRCATVFYGDIAYVRDLQDRYTKEDIAKTALAVEKMFTEAEYLKNLTAGMSDMDMGNTIAAYLANKYSYDYSYTSLSARDLILSGSGTCGAFAALTYTYCNYCGLDCESVLGTSKTGEFTHAWVEIHTGGQTYYIDSSSDSIRRASGVPVRGMTGTEELQSQYTV